MSSLKSDLFVQFRVFYNKEFTRQKKVTNKLFISVWCVIIARRADIGQSAKGLGWLCVDVVVYIEGYFFVLLKY